MGRGGAEASLSVPRAALPGVRVRAETRGRWGGGGEAGRPRVRRGQGAGLHQRGRLWGERWEEQGGVCEGQHGGSQGLRGRTERALPSHLSR